MITYRDVPHPWVNPPQFGQTPACQGSVKKSWNVWETADRSTVGNGSDRTTLVS